MNTSVCWTSTWTVLLYTRNFTAFIAPPGVPREILPFKTENVYSMGTR